MSDEQTTEKAESSTPPVKAPAEVVASIKKFVAGEGGAAKAVLQPIGTAGVRITLVGESDGYLGDRVVDDIATAHAVVDAVPGHRDRGVGPGADVEGNRVARALSQDGRLGRPFRALPQGAQQRDHLTFQQACPVS